MGVPAVSIKSDLDNVLKLPSPIPEIVDIAYQSFRFIFDEDIFHFTLYKGKRRVFCQNIYCFLQVITR